MFLADNPEMMQNIAHRWGAEKAEEVEQLVAKKAVTEKKAAA